MAWLARNRLRDSPRNLLRYLLLAWACGTGALCGAQGSSSGTEDSIRAAMVQHLAMFVQWPEWKTDSSHPQFNVCLIGNDPIGPALSDAFRGKPVLQKSVAVLHLLGTESARDCHILYIGANARRQVQRDVAQLEQAAVLTVSERSESSGAGQIIGLPKDDNHVRIEVNLKAATESKLTISSRLLQLATITESR